MNDVEFGTRDLATGIPTLIAPQSNFLYTGRAYSPNGALYGSAYFGSFEVDIFGSIDPTTGTFTLIGTPPNAGMYRVCVKFCVHFTQRSDLCAAGRL
jgi:hypothetical protein